MTVLWHKRAAEQLYQIEHYILQVFGERARQEFMKEVEQTVLAVSQMPSMGKLDPISPPQITIPQHRDSKAQ